ncbi:MAG TPA: OmpA family protein, partial [Polyangiaceae bacterium]|nr:OmpA family protein [Polyangiaceae bacterium]
LLTDHPELELINIEGHTDSSGSARGNLKLSRERAAAVVAWLVRHGVAAQRLKSEGFGASVPIDTNDTAEGRSHNRRLELRIVRRKDGKKPAPGR